jgi:hypothetical protein
MCNRLIDCIGYECVHPSIVHGIDRVDDCDYRVEFRASSKVACRSKSAISIASTTTSGVVCSDWSDRCVMRNLVDDGIDRRKCAVPVVWQRVSLRGAFDVVFDDGQKHYNRVARYTLHYNSSYGTNADCSRWRNALDSHDAELESHGKKITKYFTQVQDVDIGDLVAISVGHDSSGDKCSWFLESVVVQKIVVHRTVNATTWEAPILQTLSTAQADRAAYRLQYAHLAYVVPHHYDCATGSGGGGGGC